MPGDLSNHYSISGKSSYIDDDDFNVGLDNFRPLLTALFLLVLNFVR